MFARLRTLGMGIVLDDFGTGYSSLSYLCRFALSKFELDRGFIADLRSRCCRHCACDTQAVGDTRPW